MRGQGLGLIEARMGAGWGLLGIVTVNKEPLGSATMGVASWPPYSGRCFLPKRWRAEDIAVAQG